MGGKEEVWSTARETFRYAVISIIILISILLIYNLGYNHGRDSVGHFLNYSQIINGLIVSDGKNLVFMTGCNRTSDNYYDCGRLEVFD